MNLDIYDKIQSTLYNIINDLDVIIPEFEQQEKSDYNMKQHLMYLMDLQEKLQSIESNLYTYQLERIIAYESKKH